VSIHICLIILVHDVGEVLACKCSVSTCDQYIFVMICFVIVLEVYNDGRTVWHLRYQVFWDVTLLGEEMLKVKAL
jgi:hypothetical protein